MCRPKAEGGRRCGCSSAALDAHNARRRINRQIRRNAAAYAEAQGLSPELIEQLRKRPPGEVKEWLKGRGLDPSDFVDVTPAAAVPADTPAGPALAASRPAAGASTWWWATPDLEHRIERANALPVAHPDEIGLREGEVAFVDSPDNMGTNETSKIVFSSGDEGYHKPFSGVDTGTADAYGHRDEEERIQPMHEVAAWRLASALGEPWATLVPPTVLRQIDGEWGSLQAHRDGSPPYGPSVINPESKTAAAFFDALVGQQDRHAGNMLVDEAGKLSLIDHGFAFAKPGDRTNISALVLDRHRAGRSGLTEDERAALRKLTGSQDTLGLGELIGADRAAAVRVRAELMLARGMVLTMGEY